MKKNLLPMFFIGCVLFTFFTYASAQEKKTGKISIQITENDKVVTDTIIYLEEGQDPKQIERIISDVVGKDIYIYPHERSKHKIVSISSDDDIHTWHMEDLGIDLDSLKKAHGGGKLFIMKRKNGDIEIKELSGNHGETLVFFEDEDEGEEQCKIVLEGLDDEGGTYVIKAKDGKMIVVTHKEGGEDEDEEKGIGIKKMGDDTVKVKTRKIVLISEVEEDEEGKKKVVIKTYDGKDLEEVCEGEVKVIVTTEEDMDWVESEEEDEDIKVYIIEKEDKEVKKHIKVKVEKAEEDEEVEQKEEKKEKEKK